MILEYKSLPLPPSLSAVTFKDWTLLEQGVQRSMRDRMGESIGLIPSELPIWGYLLILRDVYLISPEIIFVSEPGFAFVLRTTYREGEVTRPEHVHVFSGLLEPSVVLPEDRAPEIRVDLATLPYATPGTMREVIETLKAMLKPTDRVVFSGETAIATALMCYVLWKPYARELFFEQEGKRIALSLSPSL